MDTKKNILWMTDISTILEVYNLAKERGKKAGDDIQDEFYEIMKRKQEKFKILGTTDKDIDMLTGELRDKKMKIVNLKEIERQAEIKNGAKGKMINKKWTKEQLQEHIKENLGDYSSTVVIAMLYNKLYGEYPKIGMSGQQLEFAKSVENMLPNSEV